MTTDRTITLTPDQARAVLIGIGTTHDNDRAQALRAMADALIVADEPVPVAEQDVCECGACRYCRAARAVDNERGRRTGVLVAAVGRMIGRTGAPRADSPAAAVHDAYHALSEYAPLGMGGVGPAGALNRFLDRARGMPEPAPAEPTAPVPAPPDHFPRLPWSQQSICVLDRNGAVVLTVRTDLRTSADDARIAERLVMLANRTVTPLSECPTAPVRAELHELAPLPWHTAGSTVRDRNYGKVLDVDIAGEITVDADVRIAEQLVELVNRVPQVSAPAEPAPAPMSRVRAELHALAPLPWTADGGDVEDADGHRQFEVLGQNTNANDTRLAELVARIVNEAEPATPSAAVALRALAVDEVLAAARRLRHPRNIGERTHAVAAVIDALDALDALDGPPGAA